ncbi:DUF397 domain-containing protein [Nocardia yamanashiensis]|uniref:DUF397 domain-containing protein n=1 Tax=Nocardia yamanashiensis TaxID=209247 RepID=UPI001E473379|nr:DUF397 domain-containing protein [Nocardia yamanashiensis]UGT44231.1 DUF397 domain-containing protein [Nocardia yamanashiensis]
MTTDLPGAVWFKSSHSGSQGDCVEVAWLAGGVVGVRDSKDPAGPPLLFTPEAWDSFTAGVAAGVLD